MLGSTVWLRGVEPPLNSFFFLLFLKFQTKNFKTLNVAVDCLVKEVGATSCADKKSVMRVEEGVEWLRKIKRKVGRKI